MNHIILEDCKRLYKENIIDWNKFKDTTILITGAYGMLPSYMVWMFIYLNEYESDFNIKIIALCRNVKKASTCYGIYLHKEYLTLLISDVTIPINIADSIDYIIHAASPASSQYYDTNPVGVISPNVLGTYNTLELAKNKCVKGYLYFSSGEIYGHIEKETIVETDSGYLNPLEVRSCYGESKRLGETFCKAYSHQFGVPVVVVRPSHTYGPTMDLKNDQRVFTEFVNNILKNEDICIKSDGQSERCFCYIYDATLAYFKVLLDGQPGEAYNVANKLGQLSILELAQTLVNLFPEQQLSVYYKKRDKTYLENNYKKQAVLSTDKLEHLNWHPKISIAEGFKRTIQSFGGNYENN